MCSELTPRARIPDTRIPQLMQPCTHTYFYNEEGQRWLYLPSPCCIFSTRASFSRAARPFPPGPFLRVESYWRVQNVGQFLLPFIIAAPSLSNPLNSFSQYSTIVFFLQNHSSLSVSLTFAQGAVLITWIAGITLSLDTQLNCVSPDKLLIHCCIALQQFCAEKTRR